jgi:hypothetical protein
MGNPTRFRADLNKYKMEFLVASKSCPAASPRWPRSDARQSAIEPPHDRNNRRYDEHSYNWGFEHDAPSLEAGA